MGLRGILDEGTRYQLKIKYFTNSVASYLKTTLTFWARLVDIYVLHFVRSLCRSNVYTYVTLLCYYFYFLFFKPRVYQ